jgi:hypothetical protein
MEEDDFCFSFDHQNGPSHSSLLLTKNQNFIHIQPVVYPPPKRSVRPPQYDMHPAASFHNSTDPSNRQRKCSLAELLPHFTVLEGAQVAPPLGGAAVALFGRGCLEDLQKLRGVYRGVGKGKF